MKKRLQITALLLLMVLLLSACSAATEEGAAQGGQAPAEVPVSSLPEDYNPAAEEDKNLLPVGAYDADGNKIYAGATPIPIDPIDLPTATPRPELTFTFGAYTADKLGLTFESAVGYEVNDALSGIYVLTEPAAAVKDNYPCVVMVEVTSITKNYTTADVKSDLSKYLQNEGKQYDKWETYQAATTTMMGQKGYYNNYRGVLPDGTIVRGRVCMVIMGENQLLTVHVSCPGWYNSSYMKVFDQVRKTIKKVQ